MDDDQMSHRTPTQEPERAGVPTSSGRSLRDRHTRHSRESPPHAPAMPMPTPAVLAELAHVVAAALDGGDDAHAWALTRTLEELLGTDGDRGRPPGPVIGRRFARAHRLLLSGASAVLTGV